MRLWPGGFQWSEIFCMQIGGWEEVWKYQGNSRSAWRLYPFKKFGQERQIWYWSVVLRLVWIETRFFHEWSDVGRFWSAVVLLPFQVRGWKVSRYKEIRDRRIPWAAWWAEDLGHMIYSEPPVWVGWFGSWWVEWRFGSCSQLEQGWM